MTRGRAGPGRVAVVTDSTACLPAAAVSSHDVAVVPLQVRVGDDCYDDGTPATAGKVASALRSSTEVSTSRPAPETFRQVYARLARDGAPGVVSVHLSGETSGTAESAALAAREAPVPVDVVDSRQVGMGTGFAVLAAAEMARTGGDVAAVAAAARHRAERTRVLLYVDSLEHLRRGGRIGAARALLGSALSVKPLLHLVDGRITPLERVRTSSRAVHRLEELAAEAAGEDRVDLAVHHVDDPGRAQGLADRLRTRLPRAAQVLVCEVAAVIGAHVGPGMLAVVIAPR